MSNQERFQGDPQNHGEPTLLTADTQGADSGSYQAFLAKLEEQLEVFEDGFTHGAEARLDEIVREILQNSKNLTKDERRALAARVTEIREQMLPLADRAGHNRVTTTKTDESDPSASVASVPKVKEKVADLDKAQMIKEIERKMADIEMTDSPVMTKESDRLSLDTREMYTYLDRLQKKMPESEYKALELSVLLFDYRMTKRILHFTVQSHEWSEVSYRNFTGDYKQEVFTTRIYSRAERLIQRVESGEYAEIDDDFIQMMKADFDRAKNEAETRMDIFMTEQSLTDVIWWNGSTGETAKRGIPGGAGNFFFVYQNTIDGVVKPSKKITSDARLRFKEEVELNVNLPRRIERIRNFKDPEKHVAAPFTPSVNGEIMRLLDKLYANKLPGAPADFYKTMHITSNRVLIPGIIKEAFDEMYRGKTDKDGNPITVSEKQVKRVFYLHTLFLNHSMLLPSSPGISDTAYYANQLPKYAIGETKQGVATYDLLTLLLFVGKFDANQVDDSLDRRGKRKNPKGKRHIFDIVGRVDKTKLPQAHTFAQQIARVITPVQGLDATSFREKMLDALHASHSDSYNFLADAPFITLHKNSFGYHQFFPLPLQFMVFEDKTATYAKDRDAEIRVKRWEKPGSTEKCAPITAADYVNDKGEILYESIPWNEVLGRRATLLDWYNNGENILNFLNLYRAEATGDIPSGPKLAAEKKKLKYGAPFVPVLGLEAMVGRIDGDKLFDRVLMLRTLGQAIYMLIGEKTLHDVEHRLTGLAPALTAADVEAISIMLKSAYGSAESAEEFSKLLMEQIENVGKYKG